MMGTIVTTNIHTKANLRVWLSGGRMYSVFINQIGLKQRPFCYCLSLKQPSAATEQYSCND